MGTRTRAAAVSIALAGIHLVTAAPTSEASMRYVTITIDSVSESTGQAIMRIETICEEYVISFETGAYEPDGGSGPAPNPRSGGEPGPPDETMAAPGTDYESSRGTVRVTAASPIEIPVTVYDDDTAEPHEFVPIVFRGDAVDLFYSLGKNFCSPLPETWSTNEGFHILDDDAPTPVRSNGDSGGGDGSPAATPQGSDADGPTPSNASGRPGRAQSTPAHAAADGGSDDTVDDSDAVDESDESIEFAIPRAPAAELIGTDVVDAARDEQPSSGGAIKWLFACGFATAVVAFGGRAALGRLRRW